MRRLSLLLLAAMAALALAACGGVGKSATTARAGGRAAGATGTAAGQRTGCRHVAQPKPKGPQHLPKPKRRVDPSKDYRATVVTSCGTFVIDLAAKRSPKTAASFAYLARMGFYDGLAFHRVARGFVIQGGDPLGTGQGGPGYHIVEPPPRSTRYTRGTVAMAKTQAEPRGTSGSQFFVVTAENASAPPIGLTPDYAVAGKVVKGQDVVDRIGLVPTQPPGDGTPTQPVVIERVTIATR